MNGCLLRSPGRLWLSSRASSNCEPLRSRPPDLRRSAGRERTKTCGPRDCSDTSSQSVKFFRIRTEIGQRPGGAAGAGWSGSDPCIPIEAWDRRAPDHLRRSRLAAQGPDLTEDPSRAAPFFAQRAALACRTDQPLRSNHAASNPRDTHDRRKSRAGSGDHILRPHQHAAHARPGATRVAPRRRSIPAGHLPRFGGRGAAAKRASRLARA